MRSLVILPILISVLFCACAFAVETNKPIEILTKNNDSYQLAVDVHLDAEFYKDFKLDGQKIVATEITIKNHENRWFLFEPKDHDTLRSSKGYFSNVWSPDKKYLVLPLGRFEGFAIYSVSYIKDSMNRLITKQYYGAPLVPETTLKIVSEFGSALWHEFIGWDGENTLVVNVGLGKEFKKFAYNINKNELLGYKHWKGLVTHSSLIQAEDK